MIRFVRPEDARELCAKELGVREFVVLTGWDNIPGLALYRSRGFVPEEETLLRKEL